MQQTELYIVTYVSNSTPAYESQHTKYIAATSPVDAMLGVMQKLRHEYPDDFDTEFSDFDSYRIKDVLSTNGILYKIELTQLTCAVCWSEMAIQPQDDGYQCIACGYKGGI